MLVLSRMRDERIILHDPIDLNFVPIVITVVDICGQRVRLGIDAPGWLAVDREEVAVHRMAERRPTRAEAERIAALSDTEYERRREDAEIEP